MTAQAAVRPMTDPEFADFAARMGRRTAGPPAETAAGTLARKSLQALSEAELLIVSRARYGIFAAGADLKSPAWESLPVAAPALPRVNAIMPPPADPQGPLAQMDSEQMHDFASAWFADQARNGGGRSPFWKVSPNG